MGLLDKAPIKEKKERSPRCIVSNGKKKIKGVLVDHLAERKVIKRMLEPRMDGLSYQKIANYLNLTKVPTKKNEGEWHAMVVSRIIKMCEGKDNF